MNLKIYKSIQLVISFWLLIISASSVLAADLLSQVAPPASDCLPPTCQKCETVAAEAECRHKAFFGSGAGYQVESITATVPARVAIVIDTVMSTVGIIFLIIVIFSGIQWMLAGGNEEAVRKAKTRITRATTGLVIVVGSWAIVNFILISTIFPGKPEASVGWGPFKAGFAIYP